MSDPAAVTVGIPIGAAVIGAAGSITAAFIANHNRGPAHLPTTKHDLATSTEVTNPKVSRSLYWGMAAMVAWVIPLLGVVCLIPGFYIAVRDLPGPRRAAALALVLLSLAAVLVVYNAALGAYEGAHGTGWWQH